MNHINSLVVEGIVESEPVAVKENAFGYVLLKIACEWVTKNSKGEYENHASHFDVRNYGNVAEIVKKRCKIGMAVRIVGAVREENGKIFIVNEHLEMMKKKKDEATV